MGETSKDDMRKFIERVVRDPLHYLITGRRNGKSCLDCVLFLQAVRDEIRSDSSYAIANPSPPYAQFHRSSNCTVEHHVALYDLLKSAGYSRIDVNAALLDFLPVERGSETRGDTVRSYLAIAGRALDVVFGQPPRETVSHAAGADCLTVD